MGRTSSSKTNKKTSESRGENGKKPQSLTESINEQVNAAEEKVQEIEEGGKPKRGKIAETVSKQKYDELTKKYNDLAKELDNFKQENQAFYILNKDLQSHLFESQEAHDNVLKQYNDLNKLFEEYKSKQPQETAKTTSELNAEEPKVDTTAQTEEPKGASSENAEEVKTDNSGTTEETVTPEAGEAKVEGEPKANTEQAQATQEPKSEAKQSSAESSEMTPEEVYDYLSDKKNFAEADTYFSSGKDGYVTKDNKRIPKSWFETFKENKDKDHSMQHILFNKNNKDVFTASLKDKGLLEDPKKEPSREEVEKTLAETESKRKFDEWIDSKGNKFRGIFGKHKVLYSLLALGGFSPAIIKGIDALGDYYVNKAIEANHVPDEEFFGGNSETDDYNGEPIEPGEVAEKVANAGQEAEQANNTAEEQAAQALQENLPQGEADTTNQSKGESPAATNASTPASTKASTAKPAPTQDTTQGLPPVVTRNTPSTNPDSNGMTYSQRVEAGQAPQAGSMAYNANNPDMVTAGLVNAMNQNPQAGSDAIGYGDLYDQNFIDFWAKRNPNLAFGVSQGRR